ncbi:Dynein assembly factor with WDR repeat domains 1 [Apostasia shenzhenica]|uniref:Dynein assembly factor with WDR repeat domains 1 n=1 Tax=Apostasia shenzhenica TaxID=1088818 RepID=A0A2I0A7K4_9ASPA|nr:Dynein assembly factor with WDR repeat domains 1 [Apostasia shenzhenica]
MDCGDPHLDHRRLFAGPYLGEISALSFFPLPSDLSSFPLLLAGTGSELLIYELEAGSLLRSFHVFDGVRVHGISLRSTAGSLIAVFGEKKLKLFFVRVDAKPLRIRLEFVGQLPRFDHWVLDAKFLEEDGYLAVGLSDNSVALWDLNGSSSAARVKSEERCLLYSMRMWGESVKALRIASGTINNEVIVWRLGVQDQLAPLTSLMGSIRDQISFEEATHVEHQHFFPVYLNRFTGHDGSILRIAWSSDGFKLVSVSDDRSARMWTSSGQALQCHGYDQNLGSHPSKKNLELFGHDGRIWDCHISDTFIITAGEDCSCRVWDVDGNQLLMLKEHEGRGIWRCLYDQNSSLLVTAGFDSAIKVHLISSSIRELTSNSRLMNDLKDYTEIFSISAPQVKGQQGLMDSKSEYVRCLHFAQEDVLYVASNNGFFYHVNLSDPRDVRWTTLCQVSKESPIICMDLMTIKPCKSSCLMEYIIAIGDGMGKATIMVLCCGKFSSKVVLSFTWVAEKERQLLGIYWCKSLGYSHLLTAGPRGSLKLWKINPLLLCNSEDNNNEQKVYLIAEFTSYYGARIMSMDASSKDEVLVCGDQRGNLTIYPLLGKLTYADSVEMVEKISSINQFKGAHGISSVTNVVIASLEFNQMEIRTTGGDGCICYFKYDQQFQLLEFVGMKQVKELSTVQSVHSCSSSEIDLAKVDYAIGFTSVDFIVWSLINEGKILDVPCGGWRRPYSYLLGDAPEYQHCFAFVKDHNIHIRRLWMPCHERQQYPRILHMQYHGREIHTLCFIPLILPLNSRESCDSLIATGCEDGTVRLTRCSSLNMGRWSESKLLGEHIGGSAVRSICFTSKIYTIGAGQTCGTSDDALRSKHEPSLLISVGAKQVLTSWILRYKTANTVEKDLNGEPEESPVSSKRAQSSISFQWLSTHLPPKYANPLRSMEEITETMIVDKASTISEGRLGPYIPEYRKFKHNAPFTDIYENDWRYLAVTAFLVKQVASRLTICFIVVACSDATLTLQALLLPYRLWFDVASLMPQPAPVLALQHVAIPLANSNGNFCTRISHIVISGSTDGSISFWDITETVEDFIQLSSKFQTQLLIDCQRRPRTGRGSRGGRWWRSSTRQPIEKRLKGSTTKIATHESSFSQESQPVREVLPLLVLDSVHQSGVNCLYVAEMKNSSHLKSGADYCVVSGGDDQAVQCLVFNFDAFDATVINVGAINGCNFYTKFPRILKRQSSNSAHSSSVKGIWTDGIWVFSTGLDQRIRCWKIGLCGELIEQSHLIVSVPEPESLDVITFDSKRYQIAVAGRGIQKIDFFAPN